MNKSLAASKNLMQNYLSELLTEDTADARLKVAENHKLNKLLQTVNVTERHVETVPSIVSKKSADNVDKLTSDVVDLPISTSELLKDEVIETKKSQGKVAAAKTHSYKDNAFQAMFFDVAGLIIAVPLIELGGIHNLEKTTSLVGKPNWFEGVMLHRDEKINIVNTAQWVMPEKCDDELKESLNYQYVIMLSNSNWGLLAEQLVDTVTLQPDDVKWLDSPSKRPWLSGLVKGRMCALLEVESLIELLNDGMDIHHT